MGKFRINLSKGAAQDLKKLYKFGRKADISKVQKIFAELEENPREGTGNPEQLKHYEIPTWSRRINKKDRLVYQIFDEEVVVTVLQALGHYNDR